ncbi:MAG: hypothetical protein M3P45_04550 [Acidobacteriota bacterium]|nr:hypothetical protein [Acidobacteriota bacterium]
MGLAAAVDRALDFTEAFRFGALDLFDPALKDNFRELPETGLDFWGFTAFFLTTVGFFPAELFFFAFFFLVAM